MKDNRSDSRFELSRATHWTSSRAIVFSKRDHKVTLRAHTWLIIRPFMNAMQDSAKRDLADESGAEKGLADRPVPGKCVSATPCALLRQGITTHSVLYRLRSLSQIGYSPGLHPGHRSCFRKHLDRGHNLGLRQSLSYHYRQCSMRVA